jgi:hypothetical protein
MQIGFWGLLTLLFIALKLTGYIAWSWWLVLLPAYFGIAVFLVVFAFAVSAAATVTVVENVSSRKNR